MNYLEFWVSHRINLNFQVESSPDYVFDLNLAWHYGLINRFVWDMAKKNRTYQGGVLIIRIINILDANQTHNFARFKLKA